MICFFLSTMFTRLTATVTMSAPDAFTALAVSIKFLYFPVPTINLDLKDLPAILKISLNNLTAPYEVNYFDLIVIF